MCPKSVPGVHFKEQADVGQTAHSRAAVRLYVPVFQHIRSARLHSQIQLINVGIGLNIQQVECGNKSSELRRTFKNEALDPLIIHAETPCTCFPQPKIARTDSEVVFVLRGIECGNDGVVFIGFNQAVPAVIARQHPIVTHIPIGTNRSAGRADLIDRIGRIAEHIDAGHSFGERGVLEEHIQPDVVSDEVGVLAVVPAAVEVEFVPQRGPVSHFNRLDLFRTKGRNIEILQRIQVSEGQASRTRNAVSVIDETRDRHQAVTALQVAHQRGRSQCKSIYYQCGV